MRPEAGRLLSTSLHAAVCVCVCVGEYIQDTQDDTFQEKKVTYTGR